MSDKLDGWRKQIDAADEKILTSLAKRVGAIKKIGKYKKIQKISALDKKRWETVFNSNLKKAEALGLQKKFIKNLLNLIHQYSLEIQEKI